MTAVTTSTISISLTGVPASELDAEIIDGLYSASLGPELCSQRDQQNMNGGNGRLVTYSRGSDTMVRQRQWSTLSAAQEKVTWLNNIPPTIPVSGPFFFKQGIYYGTISFTHVSTVVTDGQSLSQTGSITNP